MVTLHEDEMYHLHLAQRGEQGNENYLPEKIGDPQKRRNMDQRS